MKAWLRYLVDQPLYKIYNVQVDWSKLDRRYNTGVSIHNKASTSTVNATDSEQNQRRNENVGEIEGLETERVPESEVLLARQHTLLWDEDRCLDIAPGQKSTPVNIIYDRYAEDLSFPAIYYGVPRTLNIDVSVTAYMMATSEIRRRDRRGVTPQHILYGDEDSKTTNRGRHTQHI